MLDQRRPDAPHRDAHMWGTRAAARPRGGAAAEAAGCGWVLLVPPAAGRDALVMDEWGTVWWADVAGDLALFLRICPIEEAGAVARSITAASRSILRLA